MVQGIGSVLTSFGLHSPGLLGYNFHETLVNLAHYSRNIKSKNQENGFRLPVESHRILLQYMREITSMLIKAWFKNDRLKPDYC